MRGRVVLQGRYQITDQIGGGSWSVCYKAKALNDPNDVIAVKCVPRAGLSSHVRVAIKDEAVCHRKIGRKHRNILRMVAAEERPSSDVLYIGAELCPKGSLKAFAEADLFCAKTDLTKFVFLQVLDGLKAMHDLGVFHRDMKLDNILVRDDGSVVISDFTFATGRETTKHFKMGTSGYMAPGKTLRFCFCSD